MVTGLGERPTKIPAYMERMILAELNAQIEKVAFGSITIQVQSYNPVVVRFTTEKVMKIAE